MAINPKGRRNGSTADGFPSCPRNRRPPSGKKPQRHQPTWGLSQQNGRGGIVCSPSAPKAQTPKPQPGGERGAGQRHHEHCPGANVVHALCPQRPAQAPCPTHQRRAEPAGLTAHTRAARTRDAGELSSRGCPPLLGPTVTPRDLSPFRDPVLCPASPRTPCPPPPGKAGRPAEGCQPRTVSSLRRQKPHSLPHPGGSLGASRPYSIL